MPGLFLWVFVLGVGASVGSFLNVCVHRLPDRRSIVRPGSACPACGHLIAWHDNIPLLSYVLLRGRCRHCRARISPRYPLVEAATALLFALLFARHGLSPDFVLQALLSAALIALILIDARHQSLPTAITVPGIALGLVSSQLRAVAASPSLRESLLGYAFECSIPCT